MQITSKTLCWPFILAVACLSTFSSVPWRSSNILQYDGWRMSTSLLCFEILLDAAALISPEVVSPDEVTLESRVSLLPITTWNKIGTRKLMITFRIYRSNSSQKHNSKISLPCCLSSWRILLQPMMWRRWLKESPWNFIKKSLRPSSNCYTDFIFIFHS